MPEVVPYLLLRKEGLTEPLVSRVGKRGATKLITEEAFEELQEAMKRGGIATIAQAHRFLSGRGVHYAHPESVGGLLTAFLKTTELMSAVEFGKQFVDVSLSQIRHLPDIKSRGSIEWHNAVK
jgi:spermidine synthase